MRSTDHRSRLIARARYCIVRIPLVARGSRVLTGKAKKILGEYGAKINEQKNKELNDKLSSKVTTFKEKTKVKKEYIYRYIDREVKKYDNQCVIPKPFVDAHNQAAEKAK